MHPYSALLPMGSHLIKDMMFDIAVYILYILLMNKYMFDIKKINFELRFFEISEHYFLLSSRIF